MGKKSRGKRERREAETLEEAEFPFGAFLEAGLLRDDPAGLLALAAVNGRRWLLSSLPDDPWPFPYRLAQEKAPRCLAAYVALAAQEAKAWLDDEEADEDDDQDVLRLSQGFFALAGMALVFSKDGLPHPAQEIREAIASVFESLRDDPDLLADFKARLPPVIRDDWDFVARERLADEEAVDLWRAIGDAGLPKEGGPEAEKEPGGL